LSALQIASALNLILPAGNACDGFAVGDVLFREDAVGEGVGVVGFKNRNGTLQNDGAVVEVLVDKVDSAAGDFDTVVEGLLLCVESRESGQQGRMNVEDAIRECSDEASREQTHVAGEADEVDSVFAKAGDEVGIVLSARTAFRNVDGGGQIELAGGGNSRSVGNVGEDNGDFSTGESAFPDRFCDSEKVGAAAREQYAYVKGRFGFRAFQ
jgi:hypothetical protein